MPLTGQIVHSSGKSTICAAFHRHSLTVWYSNTEQTRKVMKRLMIILATLIGFTACTAPKAYYETKEGKRKQKYYNDIQYGRNAHPKMKF
jgi:hypothetical protein